MAKSSSIKKKLQKILSEQSFHELKDYSVETNWHKMSSDERVLLAKLFIAQAEKQLEQGSEEGLESLDLAVKAAPEEDEILCEIALIYYSVGGDNNSLDKACELMDKAVQQNPLCVDYFHIWGNIISQQAYNQQDLDIFRLATEKYAIAEKYCLDFDQELLPLLYWHWALCCQHQGKLSGEGADVSQAVTKYREAADLGMNEADFWNDYGNAMVDFCHLFPDYEPFAEALPLFQKAIDLESNFFEACVSIAICYQEKFELTLEEECLQMAYDYFERAVSLREDNPVPWLKWAQLLAMVGKLHHDTDSLHLASEKFTIADQYDPNNPVILGSWGETQTLYGAYTDQLRFIQEAEEKIKRAAEDNNEIPFLWFIYGSCLNALGNYFGEESYYRQAIKKFQQGLSLDNSEPHLWFGLAHAYYAIGEMHRDRQMLEHSTKLFSRVIEFGGYGYPQFWNDWGVALMKIGDLTGEKKCFEAAVDKYDHAILQDQIPIMSEWLYNYGCCLDYLWDYFDDPTNARSVQVRQGAIGLVVGSYVNNIRWSGWFDVLIHGQINHTSMCALKGWGYKVIRYDDATAR